VERRLREGGAVLVSEPLARKEGLAPGDSLRLSIAGGAASLVVAGIGYDYSTEAGLGLMTRATLESLAGPGEFSNVALYFAPGADAEVAVDRLRTAFAGRPLVFRSNSRLREEILGIFDQTFAITRILQVMALLIAVCGISLTLVIMARERAAEFALLRALGATRGQVLRLLVGEGSAMGVAGLLLGLVGGAGLAAILILLINRAYFGWTIRFGLPAGAIVVQAAWILAGALIASILPALRGSRTAATELTREDLQ
jgi:putative ABC transport system permease protein